MFAHHVANRMYRHSRDWTVFLSRFRSFVAIPLVLRRAVPSFVRSVALISVVLVALDLGKALPPFHTVVVFPSTVLSVTRGSSSVTSNLAIGVTHTEHSLDPWGDASAVAAGRKLLQSAATYQNQHIMGWGAANPESAPGTYDWSSLDRRVALMRQTTGIPVITLCCSPTWMLPGGEANMTDWNRLADAPDPAHYGDFADLAKHVALRYPDVKYFQVWNELKGFYNMQLNRWDYEAYTAFYNLVYDAVKSVRPTARIGGPYATLESWGNRDAMSNPSDITGPYGTIDQRPLDVITYWLANKHGADFICVDISSAMNWDGIVRTDEFAATQKYVDMANWIKQRTDLPIWWSEWQSTSDSNPNADDQYKNAVQAVTLIQMANSGVAVPLKWGPQSTSSEQSGMRDTVWSDTENPGGGQPLAFYGTAKAFKEYFGPGVHLYNVNVSDPTKLAAIASATRMLVVNKTNSPQTVVVNGKVITFAAFEVRVV